MGNGKRLRALAATESCGLRHYSKADTGRLVSQRRELIAISRSIPGGTAFHVAKALKAHPLYVTESQKILSSGSFIDRPGWDHSAARPGRASALSNKFTASFAGNYEDSSIGSTLGREQRREREKQKKMQKQQERIALYESLIAQQEKDRKNRAERRKLRAKRYRIAMEAATKIQSLARVYLAKLLISRVIDKKQNYAALVVQMCVRQFLVRVHVRNRVILKIQTKASKKIQHGWSQRMLRVEAQEDLKRLRQQRSRARRRLLREMENERRRKAATMIQTMVRCWKGRRLVKLLEMERRRKRRRNRKKGLRSSRGVLPPKA